MYRQAGFDNDRCCTYNTKANTINGRNFMIYNWNIVTWNDKQSYISHKNICVLLIVFTVMKKTFIYSLWCLRWRCMYYALFFFLLFYLFLICFSRLFFLKLKAKLLNPPESPEVESNSKTLSKTSNKYNFEYKVFTKQYTINFRSHPLFMQTATTELRLSDSIRKNSS